MRFASHSKHGLFALLVVALCMAAPGARSDDWKRPRLFMIVCDGLTLDDLHLGDNTNPHLASLAENGALGLMNCAAADPRTDTAAMLTLATGRVARAEPTDEHAANDWEKAPGERISAAESHKLRLGLPPPGPNAFDAGRSIKHLGIRELRMRGLDTARLGAVLADAVPPVTTRSVGNADTSGWRRRAALLTVDGMGVGAGVVALRSYDPSRPFGLTDSPPAMVQYALWSDADFTVIQLGDGARAETARPHLSDAAYREAHDHAVRLLNMLVFLLTEKLQGDRADILIVSPRPPAADAAHPAAWNHLTPIIGYGPNFPPGTFSSASTRTLSLISNVFTERTERARAIGLWGASAGIAVAVGPIAGGWLLGRYSWSSIFFAMGPVAAIAILLIARAVPRSTHREAGRTDYAGLLLSTAFMGLLVYTIIEAPAYGWASTRTIAGFVSAALCLAAFILSERRTAHPMLDVRLFRNMRFSAASGSVTVAFFTLFGFIFLMVQYFQVVRDYTPLSTGVHLLPVALALAVGSVAGTQLAVRVGTKLVVTTGLVAMTAFYVWVAASLSATLEYNVIALQMVLFGLGMGLTSTPATESIMGAISRRQAGIGSAVNDATRLLGGTLGVAVIGSVYASLYRSRLAAELPVDLPRSIAASAQHSVAAAFSVASTAQADGHVARAAAIHHAASDAFIHGLQAGCLVAGGVAAGGIVLAALFLPSQPAAVDDARRVAAPSVLPS